MPGTSDVNRLEPCPFCDSTDLIEEDTGPWSVGGIDYQRGWIKCNACQAEGPPILYGGHNYQPVRDAWNNGVKTK